MISARLTYDGGHFSGRYGNPDLPEEWDFLKQYSSYHALKPGAAPPTLFTTSTRDDRVHPAHARKMVGKMTDLGMPALYYENIEGGHGGAADNKQRAYMSTLAYSFLKKALFPAEGKYNALTPALDALRGPSAPAAALDGGSAPRGLPKWMAPFLAAVGFAALAVRERR
jgi:hypothetical protein